MPNYDTEEEVDRKQLKRALKWALRPDGWRKKQDDARLREWFVQKLEGSMAWGIVDKSKLPSQAWQVASLHYVEEQPIGAIAHKFRVKEKAIAHYCSRVLDYIVYNAPKDILASLCPTAFYRVE